MRVSLLAYTQNPEIVVAAAALTSTSKGGPIDRFDKYLHSGDIEKSRALIRRVLSKGHDSIVEHVSFTFGVEGVSRALTHELVRHRIASYTQQSQRYVEYDNLETEFEKPWFIEGNDEAKKIYNDTMKDLSERYKKLLEIGIKKEDARMILPNAALCNIVVTMNARSLRNFFSLRCCNRAQWHIRKLAEEMLKLVKPIAPSIFEDAGPKCVRGPCPEGDYSCGKMELMRKYYKEL